MATNKVSEVSARHTVPVVSGITAGDPVVFGSLPGVALTDRDTSGNATVEFPYAFCLFDLSVKGVNDAGNVAVAVGDPLFYIAADTPDISKKSSGQPFGVALEAISSGGTDTIKVAMVPGAKYDLKQSVISGGAAGAHTVTGIAVGDELVSVMEFATAASIATLTDLTSEFTISDTDEIDNTDGTATTSDALLVTWVDRT
jgi:hypothetical protein